MALLSGTTISAWLYQPEYAIGNVAISTALLIAFIRCWLENARLTLRPRRSITGRVRHPSIKNSQGIEAVRIEMATAMTMSNQSDSGISCSTWTKPMSCSTWTKPMAFPTSVTLRP